MKDISIIQGKLVQCRTFNIRKVILHFQHIRDFLNVWQISGVIEDTSKALHQDPLADCQDQLCQLHATRSCCVRDERNLGCKREHWSGKILRNWRSTIVDASIFMDAILRWAMAHSILLWQPQMGQWCDAKARGMIAAYLPRFFLPESTCTADNFFLAFEPLPISTRYSVIKTDLSFIT